MCKGVLTFSLELQFNHHVYTAHTTPLYLLLISLNVGTGELSVNPGKAKCYLL